MIRMKDHDMKYHIYPGCRALRLLKEGMEEPIREGFSIALWQEPI